MIMYIYMIIYIYDNISIHYIYIYIVDNIFPMSAMVKSHGLFSLKKESGCPSLENSHS